ncbi:MAG: peptidoglycan DD-metalloendopeptidase family protein [Patescibacteria group bacterium]
MRERSLFALVLVLFVPLLLFGMFTSPIVRAQSTNDIQQQIADHNKKIADLEAEIATYQKQLNQLGTQHATLATSIKSLDVSRAQLTAKIKSLQQKIGALNLELKQLGNQIADKQQSISLSKRTLAQSLRNIDEIDSATVVEQVFAADNLTEAWAAVDANVTLNAALRSHSEELSQVKHELTAQQESVAKTQAQLTTITTDLSTQKKAVEVTTQQKAALLAQTKNKESAYQQLITTKRAQQKAFESVLAGLESSLKSVGAGSIPRTGSGILSWPTTNHAITQYFGNTAFAKSGAYNGAGHNGIDIGIPIGTPLGASLSGTVLATGNTDAIPGCYSFGKWVMINHANGLSTMYAHLSQVSVAKGATVTTGQIIGYSGMTGYATGPHLHFGVYATAGVQITTLRAARGATSPCAGAPIPIAPTNAYLNPMSYL